MQDEELERLLADLESDRVERKQTLSSRTKDKIAEAICAFANDLPEHNLPGIVFVGASDDGAVTSEAVTDDLLLELAAIRDASSSRRIRIAFGPTPWMSRSSRSHRSANCS